MNKNEQGQEEGEWGESGRRRRKRGTLFKQIPNFETMAGKAGEPKREGKGSWPCMTPARASLPAHYFASLPLQSQRKNFNVDDDDDDDALLTSLYDLHGDETAVAK